jgi:hypothetical protein
MRLQPSAASPIPAPWAEFIAVDPCRPLEAWDGNIVRAFTIQRFGRTVKPFAASHRFTISKRARAARRTARAVSLP